MKIKFNETGGQVKKDSHTGCHKCVFDRHRFCEDLDSTSPLFISCKKHIFIKSNLDIFEL